MICINANFAMNAFSVLNATIASTVKVVIILLTVFGVPSALAVATASDV